MFVTCCLSAESPLSPPSALFCKRFGRSVQVRCSRFSRCCHLIIDLPSISRMEVGPGDCRSHRNSALGLCASCLSISTTLLPAGWLDDDCAAVHKPLRSPTSDEAVSPTSAPPPPLVSCHSCHRARPASDPSAADHWSFHQIRLDSTIYHTINRLEVWLKKLPSRHQHKDRVGRGLQPSEAILNRTTPNCLRKDCCDAVVTGRERTQANSKA